MVATQIDRVYNHIDYTYVHNLTQLDKSTRLDHKFNFFTYQKMNK